MAHERHPNCLETLPVDSCHWPGCEDGIPPEGLQCYHNEEWWEAAWRASVEC